MGLEDPSCSQPEEQHHSKEADEQSPWLFAGEPHLTHEVCRSLAQGDALCSICQYCRFQNAELLGKTHLTHGFWGSLARAVRFGSICQPPSVLSASDCIVHLSGTAFPIVPSGTDLASWASAALHLNILQYLSMHVSNTLVVLPNLIVRCSIPYLCGVNLARGLVALQKLMLRCCTFKLCVYIYICCIMTGLVQLYSKVHRVSILCVK